MSNMDKFYDALCANPDDQTDLLRILKAMTNASVESLAAMSSGTVWQLW